MLKPIEKQYLAIEVQVLAGEFADVKLPKDVLLRIDRVTFAEGWHDGLLVNLTVGKRKLSRIPAARFLQGLELGWTVDVGEELSMTIVNITCMDRMALGCIDYIGPRQ